jgi:hypothetical protein
MDLAEETREMVRAAIREKLRSYGAEKLIGVSCIALGADQIFAAEVLDSGGDLEVILPSRNYREAKVKPANLATFDTLLGRATTVRYLPFPEANREAYEAANAALLHNADRLVAVWDGQPPTAKGGTATTVVMARERGLAVDVLWPHGARRGA